MNPDPADWKERAFDDFARWLHAADATPPTAAPDAEADAPDLHSLLAELTALRHEARTGNRRAAESAGQTTAALQRCEATLTGLLAFHASTTTDRPPSRAHCLALVELHDRLARVAAALDRPPSPPASPPASPPRRGWLGTPTPPPPTDAWAAAWESVRQGLGIVQRHTEAVLTSAGVLPIPTRSLPFDPLRMVAIATEPHPHLPTHHVTDELAPGYEFQGEILRAAEVKVCAPPAP